MDMILPFVRKHKFTLTILIVMIISIASLPQLGKFFITQLIRSNGFPRASLNEFYITPKGVDIGTINLDGDGFSYIENVSVSGSWFDILLKQKIDRLMIKKIGIMGEITPQNKFLIAGWNGKIPQSKKKSSSGLLPIRQLSIDNAIFDLSTSKGGLRFQSRFNLQTEKNVQNFIAHVQSEQRLLSLDANLNGSFKTDGTFDAKLDILNSRYESDDLSLARGSGWLEYSTLPNSSSQYAGQIDAGKIQYKNFTLNSANVTLDSKQDIKAFLTAHPADETSTKLEAQWTQTPVSTVHFKVSAPSIQRLNEDFQFLPKEKKIFGETLPLTIQIDIPTETALTLPLKWTTNIDLLTVPLNINVPSSFDGRKFSFDVPSTKFDASIINRIVDLTPYSIALESGSLDVNGHINMTIDREQNIISGPFYIDAKNVKGTLNDYGFQKLSTNIVVSQFAPLLIQKPYGFSIGVLETGMPIEKISGTVHANEQAGFVVSALKANVAGGTVAATPITLKAGTNLSSTVSVQGLNLTYLFAKENSDLSAEGKFSGIFPITFRDNDLHISKGLLQSKGGVVRYNPKVMPAFLAGDDDRIKTVRLALSDYRFDFMEIFVNGAVNGNLQTILKANGKNPVFDQRPVKLNLNIEGALVPAIKQALQPASLSDKIQKELLKDKR